MANRKLSGDWDSEKEYRKNLMESPSYIDGTNVLKEKRGKSDNGFYGHLCAGSVKSGKIKGVN